MSSALCPGYALIRSDGSPGLQEALSAASNFIITNSIQMRVNRNWRALRRDHIHRIKVDFIVRGCLISDTDCGRHDSVLRCSTARGATSRAHFDRNTWSKR